MEVKEVLYEKRPLKIELDDTTKTLSGIMDGVSAEGQTHWSFSGGFARDIYLGYPWNDYDICSFNTGLAQQRMQEMGILAIGHQDSDEIPHDYYVDPYDFSKQQYPIHWIHADDQWAYAPKHFDFSINQICLKPDNYFYAPTYAWRDFDRKIIRKVPERMTTNILMRSVRFAAKYKFTLHENLIKEIKEKVVKQEEIDTLALIRNAQKMIEDDVENDSLALMKELGFPKADEATSIEDFIRIQNRLVVTGHAYREPGGGGYNR